MTSHENGLVRFMASGVGRGVRIVAGLALIGWGWSMRDQTTGLVLLLAGLVPLGAGVFNVCLIGPLIGAPFSGAKVRDGDQSGRKQ